MNNARAIQVEMLTLKSLQLVVETYEEIAASRMRKVKKSVLQNREFYSGMDDLYQRVMFTYNLYKKAQRGNRKKAEGLLDTNGRTLSVLISSNTGLYGDIIRKTFNLFIDNVRHSDTDVLITGRVGRQLYEIAREESKGLKESKYVEMSDNGVDLVASKAIAEIIVKYTNVIVYHGIYISILSQEATKTFVTGKAYDIAKKQPGEIKCIIEPSVVEVAKFFEKQILSSIFEQSVYEASLSKFASRMINLDFANEHIRTSIKKVKFSQLRAKHAQDNYLQLERLAGASLW